MNAQDFKSWIEMIQATRKWSHVRISAELGCSRNQIRFWQVGKGPGRTVGLACMAIVQGWDEWKAPPDKVREWIGSEEGP